MSRVDLLHHCDAYFDYLYLTQYKDTMYMSKWVINCLSPTKLIPEWIIYMYAYMWIGILP